MMQQQAVKVGMADLNIASGGSSIRTTGLGSCVGVTLYDRDKKIGGMAHVMLPDSAIAREEEFNRAKYADTALPLLIERLEKAGASLSRLRAKMAGGSQMFVSLSKQDSLRIGPRNAESCRAILVRLGIPILADDTGGSYGRTIELDCDTGILYVRSIQHGLKEL